MGNCKRQRVGRQPLANFAQHAVEIRASAVEFVDEEDARKVLIVGVQPDGFSGLRPTHAAHRRTGS
jgi:hypothetical protein